MKSIAKEKITATLEFNRYGDPVWILLNAVNEADEKILERSLTKLFKPEKEGLLKRLFRDRG